MSTCRARMRHRDGTESPCTLPKGHEVDIEDSDHYDEHGCIAPVLIHQSTLREVRAVSEARDRIHDARRADDSVAKLARVVAALLRIGLVSQGDLGLHLEPGSPEDWGQQVERWLRS